MQAAWVPAECLQQVWESRWVAKTGEGKASKSKGVQTMCMIDMLVIYLIVNKNATKYINHNC